MGRLRRVYYKKAVYHVIARGNNRQMILKEETDKEMFLMSVAKFQQRFSFKIYAFVLMDNHFHMILETNAIHNISKVMQAILLSYSRKYRREHNYVGHVWQGRFKSQLIDEEQYMLECIEYIHNNPVRARMVAVEEDYRWSSQHKYQEDLKTNINRSEKILVTRYVPLPV